MTLVESFKMGGIQFMTFISILGIGMLFYSVKSVINVFVKKDFNGSGVNYIVMFGSLAFIVGVLAQAIGLFGAFEAIQEAGDISPGLMAAGFRVSMIAPLYGVLIFIISIPIWVVVREKLKREK
ncbi:MAG: MotA/TolQ/ExbB proton channel family protein [Bacteroidetes bacterium]|nr:MotA/TolQ/ExbB proton channel family protein [Bacteroidota bacterium]